MTTYRYSDQAGNHAAVLVAGGAGFLGAHLCRRLLEQGETVICLDNLETGSWDRIEPLLADPKFSMFEHDVVEPIRINHSLKEIYNLACPASPKHYQLDPPGTLLTCVYGARNLLELAREKSARILQASTSEVYGNPLEHPQHESYRGNVNIVGLRSCYDEGKRCAETLFADYSRRYGIDIKIARIFNTYGPGMSLDDGRLVSNLIVQALNDEPMTIYGDGSQTRSLCYVDDMIDGLISLMESAPTFSGPVNLGNPDEATIIDIAEQIQALTASAVPLVRHALPPDDPMQRCPVIILAQRHLNWQPRISLSDGLRHTIADFSVRVSCV